MKQIFPGIFSDGKQLFTLSLSPGMRLFKEKEVREQSKTFLEWSPFHSKLAAGIKKGFNPSLLKEGARVLYLGCSEGQTVQHVSDIVGNKGVVVGIDVSETSMRRFLELCRERQNIVPLLANAGNPFSYENFLNGINFDVMFQDISQKNQAEIFDKNAGLFLQKGKQGIIAIKARSISQNRQPRQVFREETKKLEQEFEIVRQFSLEPFEKDHLLVVCRKK